MQNAKLVFRFPLTLLRRLFFLAARQSVQAPSALAPHRQFSVNPTPISYLLTPNYFSISLRLTNAWVIVSSSTYSNSSPKPIPRAMVVTFKCGKRFRLFIK